MHDPMTVAHEIYLGRKRKKNGNYKSPLITIWHVDPEKNTLGCRSDDSCGWFSPPYTKEERDAILKLAKDQYDNIFAKQVAYAEEKSYAYICYNQDCYGAIYWSWRALKAMGKPGWQFGTTPMTAKELEHIYVLATNPVDNFQHNVFAIKKLEDFQEFFLLVWRSFRRFYRPWYKHPRWHIRHWKVQFHPWLNFYRKYIQRCCKCGKTGFEGGRYGDWDGTKTWCGKCQGDSVAKSPIPDVQ